MVEKLIADSRYLEPGCIGDQLVAEKALDYNRRFLNLITNHGMDIHLINKVESVIVKDDFDWWFSHESKKSLNNYLWLFGRLRSDITRAQFESILFNYSNRLNRLDLYLFNEQIPKLLEAYDLLWEES